MKRLVHFTCAMLTSVAVFAQIPLENPNGGFEAAAVGQQEADIEGWSLQGHANADYHITDQDVKFGNRALRVELLGVAADPWAIQFVNRGITFAQGALYRYQIWARTNKPGAVVNFTMNRGELGGWDEIGRIGGQALTDTWTRYSMVYYAYWDMPETVESSVHLSLPANADLVPITFWFDELKIIQASTAFAETDTSGTKVTIGFGRQVDQGALMASNFSILANGSTIAVTDMVVLTGSQSIELTLASPVTVADTAVFVSYDGLGGLAFLTPIHPNMANLVLDAFSDPVDNHSTAVLISAPRRPDLRVNMFPNPAVSMVTLEGVAQIDRIDIVSLTGQLLRSVRNSSDVAQLDVSDLSKGVYLVVLRANNAPVKTLRLVK